MWTRHVSNQVFGIPLHELQSRDTRLVNVPRVITDCVQHLRRTGLAEVGVFRQSGSESRLEEWQLCYDEGYTPMFAEGSVHDVASLLKRKACCACVRASSCSLPPAPNKGTWRRCQAGS